MALTATYLNFSRNTDEAFTFYRSVFGTEFLNLQRYRDVPGSEGQPGPSEADKDLIINVALPILGGHILMGTDVPESTGFTFNPGNNVYICLMPASRADADRLFSELSVGGTVEFPLQDMIGGDYYGSLVDKFGIQWMVICSAKSWVAS